MKKLIVSILLFPLFCSANENGIVWQGWSEKAFEQAKAEKRLVILDLEAVWCHWCHVMEEKTYSDPKVIAEMKAHYVAIRVDQDSRPDLSQRYEDYGWPATILFDANGRELAKRSGYIPPEGMLAMLQAFVKDPSPGPSIVAEDATTGGQGSFDEETRKKLQKSHADHYDQKKGGWGKVHKFLYASDLEYAMRQSQKKNAVEEKRAKDTLKLNYQLQDPAWGGVYQYSVGNWKEPHFEKILSLQTTNILCYSLGYRLWKDPKYLKTADSIYGYLTSFLLGPNGGFYTSQDADLVPGQHSEDFFKLGDAARRKKGIPRIDQHQYARENGWVIEALAHLYGSSGDEKYLATARKAAQWVIENRSLPDGGFRHDEKDPAGPYLGDTLAMGRAFLSLYIATAEKEWLTKAVSAMKFIDKNFSLKEGGFTASREVSSLVPARPQREENASLVRFANLLYQYTGEISFMESVNRGLKYLTSPLALRKLTPSTLLLLNEEVSQDPLHITVVGAKSDEKAKALFLAAQKLPENYLRAEWWDKKEGPLPRMDVTYPEMPKAAAFLCNGKRCSLPIFEATQLPARVAALNAPK